MGIATFAMVASFGSIALYARKIRMELAMASAIPGIGGIGKSTRGNKASRTSKGTQKMTRNWRAPHINLSDPNAHLFQTGSGGNFFAKNKGGGFDKRSGFGKMMKNMKKPGGFKNMMKGGSKMFRGKGLVGTGLSLAAMLAMGGTDSKEETGGLLGSLGGAAAGAALGSMIFPGVGTFLGGMLGGYLGDKGGSAVAGAFHGGTGFVPKSGKYNLRQGEAVIPEHRNMVSQMGGINSLPNISAGGGNSNVKLDAQTIDAIGQSFYSSMDRYGLTNNSDYKLNISQQHSTAKFARTIS